MRLWWSKQQIFEGFTPLIHAVLMGDLEIIKWLLEEVNVDVNEDCSKICGGFTPLLAALKVGN